MPSFARVNRFDPSDIFGENETSGDGDVEMTMDDVNPNTDDAPADHDRLIVAVDFGTTFSSVAYTRIKRGMRPTYVDIGAVKCIDKYPDYKAGLGAPKVREDVPTELWYNPNPDNYRFSSPTPDEPDSEDAEEFGDTWKSNYPASDDENGPENAPRDSIEPIGNTEEFEAPRPQCWGFGVQNQLKNMDIPKDNEGRIAVFKLLLDESKATDEVRTSLAPKIKQLKQKKFIKREEDLFTHYMKHLLQNAKDQLQILGELDAEIPVEFVLCVPAKWPTKGCRILQTAMKLAVEEVGLGARSKDGSLDLFIVSEPEAAAACVLAEDRDEICFGEVVVILDAGGGTVDAVTYKITNNEPLRMHAEVVQPQSDLCGGSIVNQRFEKRLMEKLQHEDYLEKNGKTIKSIVEAQSIVFEDKDKRVIDVVDKHAMLEPIFIDDLRENRRKGLYQNRLRLSHSEIELIFQDPLRGTREVLRGQLEAAEAEGSKVNRVILTGGFSHSPSLQHYIQDYLKKNRPNITLMIPQSPPSTVARGAVLRALRKEDGPSRITQCSYGFLCTEFHEPDVHEAHKNTKPRIDPVDGERYVPDTIDWLIKEGDELPAKFPVTIQVKHTFPETRKKLLCQEVLYVSDKRHESHYRKSHPYNKGAEQAGAIVADMTFLREQNLIQPEMPSSDSVFAGKKRKNHLAVVFDLVMIVEGRNLRYEARWPSVGMLKDGQVQKVQASGQICIAAAFQPGTA